MEVNSSYLQDTPNQNEVLLNVACHVYDLQTPTFQTLCKDAPPEYFPIVGVGLVILLINLVLCFGAIRKNWSYLETPAYHLAYRVLLMLFNFGLFATCSFLGILSPRSHQFLHFICNTFESICILFFYDMMVVHLGVKNYLDGKRELKISTPPCCCCLVCLPSVVTSPRNLKRFRLLIIVSLVLNLLLESSRVILVLECNYHETAIKAQVVNGFVSVFFLFSIWSVIVIFRNGREELTKYRYIAKFLAFKLVIFVSKFLYMILAKIAEETDDKIPGYKSSNGKQIMTNLTRISVWTGFVSICAATVGLLLSTRMYRESDYAPFLHQTMEDEKEEAL